MRSELACERERARERQKEVERAGGRVRDTEREERYRAREILQERDETEGRRYLLVICLGATQRVHAKADQAVRCVCVSLCACVCVHVCVCAYVYVHVHVRVRVCVCNTLG